MNKIIHVEQVEVPAKVFRRFTAAGDYLPSAVEFASSSATSATATGPNGEDFPVIVLARNEHRAMIERMEDLEAQTTHIATRNEESLPADMVDALLDGDNPIKVWRKHRRMTQQALADATGMSKSYISEIEGGKKDPSVKTLKAIALILNCDLDDIA